MAPMTKIRGTFVLRANEMSFVPDQQQPTPKHAAVNLAEHPPPIPMSPQLKGQRSNSYAQLKPMVLDQSASGTPSAGAQANTEDESPDEAKTGIEDEETPK